MYDNLLKDESDFHWYKMKIDVESKRKYLHYGEPENEPKKYPCKVESALTFDDHGPDYYTHKFTYQVETICKECGHKEIIWPDELK